MAEKKRAEVHAMLDRPLEGKQPEEVVVRSGLLEDLTKRLLERALQNAISDSRGLPALIPVPVTTAAASGVEWFQDMSPYCNAVDVETRMPWTPAPASIDGDTYGAACYALAGHTDRARELIGGIPADRRWQAAGTVFDIGHPAADADDELAAGPLMELVVELWPNHYMALYHAGAAAFERGELEKAEDYLTDSSPSTTWKTAGGRAREECWTAFTADLREHPWSVGVGVTSSHVRQESEKRWRSNSHSSPFSTSKARRTGELVRHVLIEKASVREVSQAMGVSRRTVYKWANRYQAGGVSGLADRSSSPHRSPRRLAQRLVRRIEQLRRRRDTGLWIAEELELAVSTVSLWLRRPGWDGCATWSHGRSWCVTRRSGRVSCCTWIRRSSAGSRASGIGSMGDDATRVAYAEVLPDEKGAPATAFVQRAIAWFRERDVHVERVITDNGSCYRSKRFRLALAAADVRHVFTRPYRPQTNGKAERFIQTAKREWAYARAYRTSATRTLMLPGFLNRYNCRRRHRALGNTTPLSRLEALV